MNSIITGSFWNFSTTTLKTQYGQDCMNLYSILYSSLTLFKGALGYRLAFPSSRHYRLMCSHKYAYMCPGRNPLPSIMKTFRLGLRVRNFKGYLQSLFYITVYSSSVIILLPWIMLFQRCGLPPQYACQL